MGLSSTSVWEFNRILKVYCPSPLFSVFFFFSFFLFKKYLTKPYLRLCRQIPGDSGSVPVPAPPCGDQHLFSEHKFSSVYLGNEFILQCKHHSVLLVLLYQPLKQAITGVNIHLKNTILSSQECATV